MCYGSNGPIGNFEYNRAKFVSMAWLYYVILARGSSLIILFGFFRPVFDKKGADIQTIINISIRRDCGFVLNVLFIDGNVDLHSTSF